jgi:hypothetical protein
MKNEQEKRKRENPKKIFIIARLILKVSSLSHIKVVGEGVKM